jgi:hypothetical protein
MSMVVNSIMNYSLPSCHKIAPQVDERGGNEKEKRRR